MVAKKKTKNLIVCMTNDNSHKQWEVQDMGEQDVRNRDKHIMHEPLLDDLDIKMLMDEDNFEIETGSRDRL